MEKECDARGKHLRGLADFYTSSGRRFRFIIKIVWKYLPSLLPRNLTLYIQAEETDLICTPYKLFFSSVWPSSSMKSRCLIDLSRVVALINNNKNNSNNTSSSTFSFVPCCRFVFVLFLWWCSTYVTFSVVFARRRCIDLGGAESHPLLFANRMRQ